ncbi:unnamed protein product [Nippostrongylus brasiliensis]|uniref:Uncharacterized protein n=1 Tax=Nippostrongylus brasiliensis TaxID=27835 RepID=A0A0N4YB77_NIPBR|nr:unnamed protein product [Nippostrongylus brasiliensis]
MLVKRSSDSPIPSNIGAILPSSTLTFLATAVRLPLLIRWVISPFMVWHRNQLDSFLSSSFSTLTIRRCSWTILVG